MFKWIKDIFNKNARFGPKPTRPTVRLELESLTDRVLLSASPLALSTGADATPPMVASLDQGMQLMAMVEQDLSKVWSMIAQEVSYALQQYEHLLGINSNVPNQSLGSPSPQAGSSTATTHEATPSAPRLEPLLEPLDDPPAPALTVNLYWDPTMGNNASTPANWDVGSLSGKHDAPAAPGNTTGETDYIHFDGTAGKGGNASCTWDYKPANTLGNVYFQNGWNQMLTFSSQKGFSVDDSTTGSTVTGASNPTITAQGGTGAVAAITFTNGDFFQIGQGNALYLTGSSAGGAIFFAGDGTAGEILENGGKVIYAGQGDKVRTNVDSLKIPVANGWNSGGVFQVNGNTPGGIGSGAVLQVSGTDAETNNVSFYQNTAGSETDILGGGTLWCVNNYTMNAGALQSTDSNLNFLKVGTGGSTPVDGSVNLLNGNVNINPGMGVYGKLDIAGTTQNDVPILNVSNATLNFKVNMAVKSAACDVLYVGNPTTGGSGKVNFGYNGGSATVAVNPQGDYTKPHGWNVLFFGNNMVTGTNKVTLSPQQGYVLNWAIPTVLQIKTSP